MKQLLSIVLTAALLVCLAACGSAQPAGPTAAATEPPQTAASTAPTEAPTEPAPTEPETVPGTLRAGLGELTLRTYDRGETVTVIGEFLDYYVIQGEEADLLVEKRFLRLATEESFEPRDGYARWNAPVYDNPYFEGEPILKCKSNFKVTVVDGKNGWLYVEWADGSGYVAEDQIRNRPATSGGGGGGGGGGGTGGGGGGGDGSDVPMGSLSHREPGIGLLGVYSGPEYTVLEETSGLILVPGAKGYLALLSREDAVKVITYDDSLCTLWYNGFEVTAQRWLIRLEGDEPYESHTRYARYGSLLYSEYQLRNSLSQLRTNTVVTVLDELPGCFVVEVDGQIGYMNPDQTSKTRISGNTGGSGGGGGGGGGGSEWTPPAM